MVSQFEVPKIGNLFQVNSGVSDEDEIFTTLYSSNTPSNIEIKHILSQRTPQGEWYDQSEDEWVALLKGRATLRIDLQPYESISSSGTSPEGVSPSGDENKLLTHIDLQSGDYILIPARMRHMVVHTDPQTVWLAIHVTPSSS